HDILSSMLDRDLTALQWVAICNLLTETKSPRLAGRLLGELTITVSITVTDGNSGWGSGGDGGSGVGCGAPGLLEGFPPIATYRLRSYASRGSVVVAPGKHPI